MIRAALLVSVLFACAGCKDSKEDPVVSVNQMDVEMNAAMAEAKRRWPEFVEAFHVHSGDRYSVKYPFPTKDGGAEHVWLSVRELDADHVTGTIDNDPVHDIGHKNGDRVTVPSADLSDWVYSVPGEKQPVGGFTVKVLLARQRR